MTRLRPGFPLRYIYRCANDSRINFARLKIFDGQTDGSIQKRGNTGVGSAIYNVTIQLNQAGSALRFIRSIIFLSPNITFNDCHFIHRRSGLSRICDHTMLNNCLACFRGEYDAGADCIDGHFVAFHPLRQGYSEIVDDSFGGGVNAHSRERLRGRSAGDVDYSSPTLFLHGPAVVSVSDAPRI